MKQSILRFLHRYWCYFFKHTHKNSHILFFIKGFLRERIPTWILRKKTKKKLNKVYYLSIEEQKYIKERVDYYCKFSSKIFLPEDAVLLRDFTYRKRESYVHDYVNSTYFYDANKYIRYFSDSLRWAYNPGDVNYLFPVPEITKSRPITTDDGNRNNILLNLDTVRHFTWVDDPFTWKEKECRIIFRGDTRGKQHRVDFIKMWESHPWCDLASTSDSAHKHRTMSIYDHLRYRYIMTLEGNDVASNLKWVMSSNSIAIMPKPKYETWYMEGKLIPNYHYIEIADDYHDLIDKVAYYETHPNAAAAIIRHAHEWVAQFRNKKREDLISLMVLDKYFRLTGQKETEEKPIVKDREKRNIFVNETVKLASNEKVNAQGKARKDVLQTFKDLGFEEYNIVNYKYSLGKNKRYHHFPFFSNYLAKIQVKAFLRQIQFGDTVVIQDFYRKYMQMLAKGCLKKGAEIIFVVHDAQSIRFNTGYKEIVKLNNSSKLIVHTQAMADKLKSLGVNTPMSILWFFDYYSNAPMQETEKTMKLKNEIVFAGNLSKSGFLKQLIKEKDISSLTFRFYGIYDKSLKFEENENIEYAGIFQPDQTGSVTGGWGLVWDGDSINTCNGELGEYLRYNSSHKASLYLACGIPLIVWKQSSLSRWVEDNNIGIVISSIQDISKTISAIDGNEYFQIITNVRKIGEKIREGGFMKNVLTHKK